MIKAIIFDFDGTLADTVPAIREGINLTMRALGYPESSESDILAHINFGARRLIRLSLPGELQDDEKKVDEALALYDKMYEKTYLHTDHLYAGMSEVLSTLKNRGYRIAVMSNKQDPFIVNLAAALLPKDCYTVARGQRRGAPAKPDPTVPLEIASILGTEPSQCAFVGDSNVDMETAKNAGMCPVGVCWGYRTRQILEEAGAAVLAEKVSDLLDIFC